MDAATFDIQVRFYELDPYGHVNHATYLQYFEAARVDLLERIDLGLGALAEQGCSLIVTTVACRFVRPAVLNDRLVVHTGLVEAQRVRAQWAQAITRDDELVACQRINFATVSSSGRPMRVPAELAEAMAPLQLPADWMAKELPDLAM